MIRLNVGSGQRPFDNESGWINIDINAKWQPDILADWNNLSMFHDDSVDMVVAHHTIEHVGCGEAAPFIRESYRILKPGASLLVFVPNARAIAQKWLMRQITDYIFNVNMYGAFMSDESDRHRWSYTKESLHDFLKENANWSKIKPFNWRMIPGMEAANDWWILSAEAIKEDHH